MSPIRGNARNSYELEMGWKKNVKSDGKVFTYVCPSGESFANYHGSNYGLFRTITIIEWMPNSRVGVCVLMCVYVCFTQTNCLQNDPVIQFIFDFLRAPSVHIDINANAKKHRNSQCIHFSFFSISFNKSALCYT